MLASREAMRKASGGDLYPPGDPLYRHVIVVGALLDNAASIGVQTAAQPEPTRTRYRDIAFRCLEIVDYLPMLPRQYASGAPPQHTADSLDATEALLASLGDPPDGPTIPMWSPAAHRSFVIPGALTKPQNLFFALKLSLCATLSYIFYHAVDWPGISTITITVLAAALGHTGRLSKGFSSES
jgi:multidrug resistance protein MdtO